MRVTPPFSGSRMRQLVWACVIFAAGAVCGVGAAGAFLASGRGRELARRVVKEARERVAEKPRARTRAETPADLSLWVVDDSTKVFPGADLGPARQPSDAVVLAGARGETVAFQVVLAAREGAPRVEVETVDLVGPVTIPRTAAEVFLEWYMDCPATEDKVVGLGPGEYPDPLIPLWEDGPGSRAIASPFKVEAARNQPLWVDIRIPRDVPPGQYAGRFRVRGGGSVLELPVALTVHDFEIPATASLTAWAPMYDVRLRKGEGLDAMPEKDATEVLWRYFRMAHEHRLITQVQEEEPEIDWDEKTGELRHANWDKYDARNGPAIDGSLFSDHEPPLDWKVGGFVEWGAHPGAHPNFGGTYERDGDVTPAHRRAIGEYAREAVRHFKEKGWTRPRLFMYMIDEPDFREYPHLPGLVKGYGDAIHASGTRIAHMATVSPGRQPVLDGAIDIWSSWGAGYVPSVMRTRQALGERGWLYHQHEPFIGGSYLNSEGLGFRTWPWISWRYGVNGVFLWVMNFWNEDPYRNARNWDDEKLGDGLVLYPGALLPTIGFPEMHGPVSSLRMKVLRRGLYDYEYFHLLRARGGDPDPLVARVMRSALNPDNIEPYWDHPLWTKHGDWSHEPREWDEVRAMVAQEILSRAAR